MKHVNIVLSDEEHRALKIAAVTAGITLSDLVKNAIATVIGKTSTAAPKPTVVPKGAPLEPLGHDFEAQAARDTARAVDRNQRAVLSRMNKP